MGTRLLHQARQGKEVWHDVQPFVTHQRLKVGEQTVVRMKLLGLRSGSNVVLLDAEEQIEGLKHDHRGQLCLSGAARRCCDEGDQSQNQEPQCHQHCATRTCP